MVSVSEDLIESMAAAIVQEVKPQCVYLFGSYTRGASTPDSDVDFLVVEDKAFGCERSRWSELKRIRKALRFFRVPKDILVYSREEFDKWRSSPNHIVGNVSKEGRLLYERP